jgi:hypothetical protein
VIIDLGNNHYLGITHGALWFKSQFIIALESVHHFNFSGDLLTLIGDKDETLMSATRKPAGEQEP